MALHQQNAGVSAARNNALAHCEGVYVQFVDCDDTLPPDSIRTMVTRAEADDSDLVIGAYNMVRAIYLKRRTWASAATR